MNRAVSARLSDGRLHLQHGPIDVLVECWGEAGEVEAACAQAEMRFASVLPDLVSELQRLREPVAAPYPLLRGAVARRMAAAVWPHRNVFITPMAAVAGAVADELMAALLHGRRLRKAYVNNGGDIAVHLPGGESLSAGIVNNSTRPMVDATIRLEGSCGIATSGWRGRSQSLGIADAVTVIARNAAQADAAATLVANAVNAEHPAIRRLAARAVKEDTDLGDLPVTVAVGHLPEETVCEALESGAAAARSLVRRKLILAAYLALQNRTMALNPEVHFPKQRRKP